MQVMSARRWLLVAGALALLPSVGRAEPLPPDALAVLRKAECPAPQGQSVGAGSFLVRCVVNSNSKQDGPVTRTRVYAAQKHTAGSAVYKLAEYNESRSPRTKVAARHTVTRSGTRVTYRAEQRYGYQHSLTWDLGASPPRLISEIEGGNRDCRQAIEVTGASYANPDLTMPRCETDYQSARQSCVKHILVCGTDDLKTQPVRVLNIPLRQAPGTGDPLACSLRVGADKQDVVVGKNSRGTSFQVVAEDDPAAGRLRVYLQAHDSTPTIAPAGVKDPLPFDHFELWIGDKREEPRCLEPGGEDAVCQARSQIQTLRVTLVPVEGSQIAVLPEGADSGAARLTQLRVSSSDGRLIVDLSEALRSWALSGVIAVRYSDSERGTRRNHVSGTTGSDEGRPESWGQLAPASLCSPTILQPL